MSESRKKLANSLLAEHLLEFVGDRFQREFVDRFAIRASEMAHENHRLGSVVQRVFNRRHSRNDPVVLQLP